MKHITLALFALMSVVRMHAQPTVELETVITGLTNPVNVVNAGDARLFIVERPGIIRILQPDGHLAAQPFLSISDRVLSTGSEQGLLGLAFHPQFNSNGYLYVYYVTGTGNGSVRVSRFSVTSDPMVADPATEVVLWTMTKPFSNHNGGGLAFGPDGYLYFAPGDGGDGGDPGNRAQTMSLGYGKVHRIDVNSGSPYGIPSTNPFATANNTDTLRSIWASGLRNPFRFSFDPLNGDFWVGDVGQAVWEEVDRWPAGNNTGPNFGWRCYEGNTAYNTAGCVAQANYSAPVAVHNHSDGSCAIIGGFVYRGGLYPNLQGRYLYSDYCHGRINSLRTNGGNGWIQEQLTASGTYGPSSFGTDINGELYLCNTENGTLYHVIDPSAVVRLSAKVFLDGPYNSTTGLMADQLRAANTIPTTEPYTAAGYKQCAKGGGETLGAGVLATIGNNAVVDWVRVELRSAAHPQTIVATRQGLVQSDGDIVAADGTPALSFTVGAGNYYVAVRHRNHLGAMTAAPVALSATSTTIDLRSSSTATYGTNARRTVGSVRTLWSGNANGNTGLTYTGTGNDRDPILVAVGGTVPTNTVSGYRTEDVNLDGVVKYTGAANDRDPILVNIGGSIPTAIIQQQLP